MVSQRWAKAIVASLPVFLIGASALAGGSIKATVTFDGDKRPRRRVIKMDADAYCKGAHKKKVGTQDYLISKKTKAIKNVVVYVKDGLGDATFEVPAEKKTINQTGCMYDPHVLTIQVGQTLVIKNSDDTLHNIHSFARKQRPFNFAQPKKGDTREVQFKRNEFVPVKCDVHPWMSAYIGVFKHPFSAVTAKDGTCTIENLKPGEYTLAAWHEELGEVTQKVTVEEGKTTEVEFALKK